MKCPYCGADDDKVVDSRSMADGLSIRRRRECNNCGRRFTTYEHIEEIRLRVIKRNQNREDFDRKKVAMSIRIACQKRPVSEEQIQELATRIEGKLHQMADREIPSSVIGEEVMRELRDIDQVAYVRFASVYRDFKTVNQFFAELSDLMKQGEAGVLPKPHPDI
ncbi:MAG: transcriptional repressor NrdR [bacterium]|nr:transcriptional repressor NrdR [bacterium]